jgi:hypothetical protein
MSTFVLDPHRTSACLEPAPASRITAVDHWPLAFAIVTARPRAVDAMLRAEARDATELAGLKAAHQLASDELQVRHAEQARPPIDEDVHSDPTVTRRHALEAKSLAEGHAQALTALRINKVTAFRVWIRELAAALVHESAPSPQQTVSAAQPARPAVGAPLSLTPTSSRGGGSAAARGSLDHGSHNSALATSIPHSFPVVAAAATSARSLQGTVSVIACSLAEWCDPIPADAAPARAMTLRTLFSQREACAVIVPVDADLTYRGGSAGGALEAVLSRTIDYHFDPLEAQVRSETEARVGTLRAGVHFFTRHANLARAHAAVHLVLPTSAAEGGALVDRESRVVRGLRAALATCASAGFATVAVPLFLAAGRGSADRQVAEAAASAAAAAALDAQLSTIAWCALEAADASRGRLTVHLLSGSQDPRVSQFSERALRAAEGEMHRGV